MSELSTDRKIIKIIKLLEDKAMSKEEILEEMEIKPSTFYKYFDLYKKAGFVFKKESNKYKIERYRNFVFLADFELSLLSHLLTTSYIMLPFRKTKELENAVKKMLYLADRKNKQEVKEKFNLYKQVSLLDYYREKIETLDKYMNEEVQILTTSKKILKLFQCILIGKKRSLFLCITA